MTLRLHCDKCPTTIALSRRNDAVPHDWAKIKMTAGSTQQVMHLCPSCASIYRPESFQPGYVEPQQMPWQRERGRKPASILTLPSARGRSR